MATTSASNFWYLRNERSLLWPENFTITEAGKLIEKFKYRHFLIEKLNKELKGSFDFGEDNVLVINGKSILKRFWNIPKDEKEVDLYFKIISDEINSKDVLKTTN